MIHRFLARFLEWKNNFGGFLFNENTAAAAQLNQDSEDFELWYIGRRLDEEHPDDNRHIDPDLIRKARARRKP